MATLTGKQLKDSYQSLVTIKDADDANPTSGQLENGLGNPITALGIGTDSPSADLTVTDGTSAGTLSIGNDSASTSVRYLQFGETNDYSIQSNANSYLRFYAEGAERMRIHDSGDISFRDGATNEAFYWDASTARLGIGTTSPDRALHVNGSVRINDGYSLSMGAGAEQRILAGGTSSNTYLTFSQWTGASFTERMRINSSGNVGIGTTSPTSFGGSYKTLDVVGGSTANGGYVRTATSDGSVAGGMFTATGGIYFGSITNNDVIIRSNSQERMRIDSSGNVLVGTTATPTSSAGNIVLGNGTAPTGNATDGVILYAEDVSTSSELKVRDEAGNVTTLSPHNFSLIPDGASEPMAWAYYSERDGKKINVDMLKLARMVESLTGEKLVYEQ